ncbi:MAG: TrkA family potassium uptake protein [Rikenellaceae bacterium]
MKYIIIGLGNYGSALAEELTMLGHEIIGVDESTSKVDSIKDKISTSFVLDATDEQALSILPLKSVDVVIVSIGEAFGASIKVVALLKKSGVKHIYARAVDEVHRTVLEAFELDNILFPERDAARNLVQLLDLRVNVESFQVDKEYYIVKFKIPASFVGYLIKDTAIEKQFNLRIISLLKGRRTNNSLGISIMDKSVVNEIAADYRLEENDHLVCYGRYKDFNSFWKAIS